MQQSQELPMPNELQALIQEFASDKVGIAPTAHLIKKLKFILTDDSSKLKIILTAYRNSEYFIILNGGGVDWDCVRSYSIAYFKVQ